MPKEKILVVDDDAATRAVVARIGAGAHIAMTTDHRHAGAGAGSEEDEFDGR